VVFAYFSVSVVVVSDDFAVVPSVILAVLSPFSNSVLAEPKLRANFGIAAPPNISTATTMTTINRSGPKISPKNTAFSFDVRNATVVRDAMQRYSGPFHPPIRFDKNSGVSEMSKAAVRDSLSVALTVGAYGVAFGAASVAAGFSVLQSCLFSLLTFTGASQFAAVGVMGAGGAAISAISAATLLGTRNALYGIQMAPLLRTKGLRRLASAHLTIDESTGVALSQAPRGTEAMRTGFWVTGTGVFIFWNLFTLLGALGAKSLGNPASYGLDAAVPAAFLGLLWPRLENSFLRTVAAVSMVFALVVTPWLAAGLPIITTVLVAIVVGWRSR
jgi:predicted branched-subunit amino acid permease